VPYQGYHDFRMDVKISYFDNKGHGLMATRNFNNGEDVFSEPAFFYVDEDSPIENEDIFNSLTNNNFTDNFQIKVWTRIILGWKMYQQILELYDPGASYLNKYADEDLQVYRIFTSIGLLNGITEEKWMKFNRIWYSNKRRVWTPKGTFHCLFLFFSKMNHSCKPNCRWVNSITSNNVPTICPVACSSIICDEELTYDYTENMKGKSFADRKKFFSRLYAICLPL